MSEFAVDFIGVGAPKCATTWIGQCLREHPEVDFAKHKETNYFITPQIDFDFSVFEKMRIKSLKKYIDEFDNDGRKKGEYSPFYFYDANAAKSIKESFPNVKVIISLRNPVDFLYSAYNYDRGSNASHSIPDTFEEALHSTEPGRLYNIEKARFFKYIQPYFDVFGRESILVLLHEDILANPINEMTRLYQFLDVNPDFRPRTISSKVNGSMQVRYPVALGLVHLGLKLLKKLRLEVVIYKLIYSDNLVKRTYERIFKVPTQFKPVKKTTADFIKTELAEDIRNVEKLIGKDLSSWKPSQQ